MRRLAELPILATVLLGLAGLAAVPAVADVPYYAWGRALSGNRNDLVRDIAVDTNGSLYATGTVLGSVDLSGDGNPDVTASTTSLFVAKYGTEGNLLWMRTMSGGFSQGNGIAVSDGGDLIVIAGTYAGTARFDFDDHPPLHCECEGSQTAAFAVAYDRFGDVLWARSFAGSSSDFDSSEADAIAIEPSGSFVSVSGEFWDGLDSDGDGSTDRWSTGQKDVFVTFLDATDGSVRWTRQVGGGRDDNHYVAAVSHAPRYPFEGQVVLAGSFQHSADFDGDGAPERESSDTGWFVVSYDSTGRMVWYTGGGSHDDATDILWDAGRGRFYVATSTFGAPERPTTVWALGTTGVVYAAESRRIAGAPGASVEGLALDPEGNLCLTGRFSGALDLDGDGVPDHRASADSETDMFVASYGFLASYGGGTSLLWSRAARGDYYDWGKSIAVDRWNRVYVGGGSLSSSISFDDDPEPELSGAGFLVRYDQHALWHGDEWHDPDSFTPMLPMEMASGFRDFELGATRNLDVDGLFVREQKGGKLLEVTDSFQRFGDGCKAEGKGGCIRFVFVGKDPLVEIAARVVALDGEQPVRFTLSGHDLKGQEYSQPPATLRLDQGAKQ